MTKFVLSALTATAVLASPAAAQSSILVIGERSIPTEQEPLVLTLDRQIEIATKGACEKPYVRDLRGWTLYDACVADVRLEIDALLEDVEGPVELQLAAR